MGIVGETTNKFSPDSPRRSIQPRHACAAPAVDPGKLADRPDVAQK